MSFEGTKEKLRQIKEHLQNRDNSRVVRTNEIVPYQGNRYEGFNNSQSSSHGSGNSNESHSNTSIVYSESGSRSHHYDKEVKGRIINDNEVRDASFKPYKEPDGSGTEADKKKARAEFLKQEEYRISANRKALKEKIKSALIPKLASEKERKQHGENIKAAAKSGAKLLWGLGNQVAHDEKGHRLSQHPDQAILGGSHPDKVMAGRSRNGNPLGSGSFRSELGTLSNGYVGDLGTPSNGYVGNLGKPSNGFVSALGSPSGNPYNIASVGGSTFNWSLASPARSNNARKKGGSYSKKNRGTSNQWDIRI